MVQSFHTQIEINRKPEDVRSIFLDFQKIPEWHQGFTVERLSTDKPAIEKGDHLKLISDGTTLIPVVLENSPLEFKWQGSFYGLLIGKHSFRFEPSTTTPGGTTFVQSEDFSGLLAIFFSRDSSMRKKTQKKFETFNSDLKARVESLT